MSVRKHYQNRQAGYTDNYQIEYERSNGHFTIWCRVHPPDPYRKGVTHHHLYESGKLCQRAGYESTTLEHAEAFAQWWMKRWSIYIRTGNFPMTPESVDIDG